MCKHCERKIPLAYKGNICPKMLVVEGNKLAYSSGRDEYYYVETYRLESEINFCPMCGRKLEEVEK